MTTALGLAAVSVVLVDLLNNGMIDHDVGSTVGGRVTVSALPPDRVLPANGTETTQLNLFLHRVTPNAGWRNIGQPTLNDRGERIGNPPLALDLHYLLSAYGEKDFYAEIVLGFAMQLLHEHPLLSRQDVATALAAPTPTTPSSLPDSLQDISKSELADQVELIKITPEPLSTEEIARLWTAFQSHYRATAAYSASVVLIQSDASTRTPLPVRSRNVYARTIRTPTISSVVSAVGDDETIVADSTIVIRGEKLRGDITHVKLADGTNDPPAADVTDTQITIDLSGHDLPAGLQSVQVLQEIALGTPPQPHRAVASNVAGFVLAPSVTPPLAKTLSSAGAGFHKGTLKVDVAPIVRAGQHAVLVLNQLLDEPVPVDAVAASYTFGAGPVEANTDELPFAIDAVADGTYLVRVQVDGADSPLDVDSMTGRFDGPTVTIP